MPRLPQLDRGAAPRSARATAETFGGDQGLGQAARALEVVSSVSEQIFESEQRLKQNRAYSSFVLELGETTAGLERDDDFGSYVDRADAARTELMEKHAEGLGARAKEEFEQRAGFYGGQEISRVRRMAFEGQAKKVRVRAQEEGERMSNAAARHPDPEQSEQIRAAYFEQLEIEDDLSPAERKSARDAFDQNRLNARAIAMELDNPDQLLVEVERRDGAFAHASETELQTIRARADRAIKRRDQELKAEARARRAEARLAKQDDEEKAILELMDLRDKDKLTQKDIETRAGRLTSSGRDMARRMFAEAQQPRPDPSYYNELVQMDRDAFLREPLDPQRLDKGEYRKLVERKGKLRDAGRLPAGQAFLEKTVFSRAQDSDLEFDDTQARELLERAEEEYAELARELGRQPDREQVRSIVDSLALTNPTRFVPSFFDPDPIEATDLKVPNIEFIRDSMVRRGADITIESLRLESLSLVQMIQAFPGVDPVEVTKAREELLRGGETVNLENMTEILAFGPEPGP